MKPYSDDNWKYSMVIAAIILSSSILIISLNFYSIRILSSIRSYVNFESQYSKAQKDAARYLIEYVTYNDIQSFKLFKKELAVSIGDSMARVALQKNAPLEMISEGFLQGRNHPNDIDNMIWLFRNFQNFPYFKEAIEKWTDADRDIAKLHHIGILIHDLNKDQTGDNAKTALKHSVNTINRRLTRNQQEFSNILGEASRVIEKLLILVNVFFIVLILATAGLYARKIFRQLVESRKQILEQNLAKDEFLSIASHELKTPLTSIKACLQIIERLSDPESKQLPFIQSANKHVLRLTNLIKDLLDVTRIQGGKLQIHKAPIQLHKLIKEVTGETSPLFSHDFIITELEEGNVNADSQRIYQVIENLLSNAAKYSPSTAPIRISSKISGGKIKVTVRDSGPGISKDKIPFLFDRFYRIDENNHRVQGLGLGLYICREIIHSHDGQIGVNSEPGNGSSFWFSLPLSFIPIKESELQNS